MNNPPAVVSPVQNLIFYQGSADNIIPYTSSEFFTNSLVKIDVNECDLNNSTMVSSSVLEYTSGKLSLIRVFFSKQFIGKCSYSL